MFFKMISLFNRFLNAYLKAKIISKAVIVIESMRNVGHLLLHFYRRMGSFSSHNTLLGINLKRTGHWYNSKSTIDWGSQWG